MRPPICEVCRRQAQETVSFANYSPLPDGMVGHPRGLGWFCRRHVRGARRLTRVSMNRAVGILRAWRVGRAVVLVLVLAAAIALARRFL